IHVHHLAEDYIALLDELEALQAQLTTTLTPCSRCGNGYRARDMATVGDERLCAACAGDELEAARNILERLTAVHLSSYMAHRRELDEARAYLRRAAGDVSEGEAG